MTGYSRCSRVGTQIPLWQTARCRHGILFVGATGGTARWLVNDTLAEVQVLRRSLWRGEHGMLVMVVGTLGGGRGCQFHSIIEDIWQVVGSRRQPILAGTSLGRLHWTGEPIIAGSGRTAVGLVARPGVQQRRGIWQTKPVPFRRFGADFDGHRGRRNSFSCDSRVLLVSLFDSLWFFFLYQLPFT